MYFYFSVWESGLYQFHKLMDSEEAARQSICKNFGCRRQQAASGNGSFMIFISSSPLSPEHLLLWLWPNGNAPSINQVLAWAVCWLKGEQDLSEQSQETSLTTGGSWVLLSRVSHPCSRKGVTLCYWFPGEHPGKSQAGACSCIIAVP